MSTKLTGIQFRDAVISGAALITNFRQQVDELNVFPVPDGDTGTNMSLTVNNAARMISRMDGDLSKVSGETASALLRGARGNSGVILSLFFRGIAKGLKGIEEADGQQLANALQAGVETAYKAVMKPTEGTMLTVVRLSAAAALEAAKEQNDVAYVMDQACIAGADALAQTPEMLPVLKKAGVVDAGGRGILYILEGMRSVIKDGVMVTSAAEQKASAPKTSAKVEAIAEEEITFTYCTEFIVQKDKSITRDPIKLRAYLETIGDCVVVVDDEDIIKVHVHTDNPGNAIQEGLKFGMLVNIKIDNMREQTQRIVEEETAPAKTAKGEAIKPAKPENEYGFVVVGAGEGICQLFSDLGADQLVEGGQTMNPSTDDILRAVEATPAKTVFVLPNNKNIIMAAEQAIPLATRKVCVLPTRTIPQGISAMLAFDEDMEVNENLLEMTRAAENTATGQITYAARNSNYDGKEIKEGEILALKEGKIAFVEKDIIKAVAKLTKALVTKDSCQVTLITGADVDEDTIAQATAACEAKAGDAEVTVIPGGQPVYYFILSVE